MITLTRARHAPWSDVRFYIGIGLVVISILGVWSIVAASRTTTAVLQADRTIVEGEALTSGDFVAVDVSLGSASSGYIQPHQLTDGLIATRSIQAGELLSSAALGSAEASKTTTIVVRSSVGLPEGVQTGSTVELWYAPVLEEGFDIPRILIADATVASVVEDDAMLSRNTPAVELVIERSDVASVLAAITDGSALSLVPVGALP